MNTESVIIDLRNQLPWQQRYLGVIFTVLLWGAWLLLWRPLMVSLGLGEHVSDHLVDQILHVFFGVLENGFIAILACALMLWLWSNFIPAQSAKYTQVQGIKDYAESFKVSAEQIHRSRQQTIVTVHHDEHGRITRIE